LLQDIKAHIIHEGGGSAIQRNENDFEKTKMMESIAELTIPFDEFDNLDLDYVLMKADGIADQFKEQMSRHIFQTMDEVTLKTGLRTGAAGKPLTNDVLIESFSKMQIDFEKSAAGDVTIIIPPEMGPTFEKLAREMNENTEVKRKWDKMIEEKRNEFREREINRNLAG
jgi:hypothetical protein